jgi:hypothetical protein
MAFVPNVGDVVVSIGSYYTRNGIKIHACSRSGAGRALNCVPYSFRLLKNLGINCFINVCLNIN